MRHRSAQRTGVQLRAPGGGRKPTDKLVSCNALLGGGLANYDVPMGTSSLPRPVLLWDDEEIGGRIYLQACHLFAGGQGTDQKSRFFEHAVSVLHKLTATKYHWQNFVRLENKQQREWENRFKTEPQSSLREAFELIFEIEAFLFQVKSSLDMLVKLLVPILGSNIVKTHTYGAKGAELVKGLTAFRRLGMAT